MTDRQGIEIDYCPQCRGIWLDRGELDKIVERAAAEQAPAYRSAPAVPPGQRRYERHDDDDYRYGYDRDYDPRKRRRKSFLQDLFDFD
jgi:Zn-finger nucleic acid-binding protein